MIIVGGCDHRPKEIANGMALYRGTKFGDRVRYMCNAGHKLMGDKYLTCEGGEWKGRLPVCKAGNIVVYYHYYYLVIQCIWTVTFSLNLKELPIIDLDF